MTGSRGQTHNLNRPGAAEEDAALPWNPTMVQIHSITIYRGMSGEPEAGATVESVDSPPAHERGSEEPRAARLLADDNGGWT